ncbi:MAG TPA: Hpt domain-containing protein, partial [Roseomonas sp.]
MDDLISEFLAETNEALAELDTALVDLERASEDAEILARIFRLVHTVKGTCGFLGLSRLETVAHAAESLLGLYRDGERSVTPEGVTAVLGALDTIRLIIAGIAETGEEPKGDDAALLARLEALVQGHHGTAGLTAPAAPDAELPLPAEEPPAVAAAPASAAPAVHEQPAPAQAAAQVAPSAADANLPVQA